MRSFSGRDDLAARGVVLGVGREQQRHVEVQPHGIPFDLDVPLLHDVEQAHLDLAREVRQLVDREDPAVGARQQAEVHRQLVRQEMPAARGLDRVHVADQVGDGHVGGRELLDVARFARQPGDRRGVAQLRDPLPAVLGDRLKRIVVDLAARQHRDLFVEQQHQLAQDAALRLSPEPQQDEVVARQDRVHELRDHRVVVAHDTREQGRPVFEQAHEVVAHLVLHGALAAGRARPFGLFQFAQSSGFGHGSRLTARGHTM